MRREAIETMSTSSAKKAKANACASAKGHTRAQAESQASDRIAVELARKLRVSEARKAKRVAEAEKRADEARRKLRAAEAQAKPRIDTPIKNTLTTIVNAACRGVRAMGVSPGVASVLETMGFEIVKKSDLQPSVNDGNASTNFEDQIEADRVEAHQLKSSYHDAIGRLQRVLGHLQLSSSLTESEGPGMFAWVRRRATWEVADELRCDGRLAYIVLAGQEQRKGGLRLASLEEEAVTRLFKDIFYLLRRIVDKPSGGPRPPLLIAKWDRSVGTDVLPHIHVSTTALAWVSSRDGQKDFGRLKRAIDHLASVGETEFTAPTSTGARNFTIWPASKFDERVQIPIYREELFALLHGYGFNAELIEVDGSGKRGVLRVRW